MVAKEHTSPCGARVVGVFDALVTKLAQRALGETQHLQQMLTNHYNHSGVRRIVHSLRLECKTGASRT